MRKLIITTVLLTFTFMLLPFVDDVEAGGLHQLRQDRLEIGRGMLEVQNVDWTMLLQYYDDDIEYHDSIVDVYGIDMLTQFLARLYGSSPDLVTTIEDETLLGGVYSATWTMVGSFNGVPYEAKGISIIKFRRWSREVYYWRDYYTEGDIMTNIPGFDEAILGFRTYYRCAVDPTFDCPPELATADALPEIEPLVDSPASDKYGRGIRSLIRLRWERLKIGRALVEINAANWQSLLPYYTDDYEYHDPIVDIYGIGTMSASFSTNLTMLIIGWSILEGIGGGRVLAPSLEQPSPHRRAPCPARGTLRPDPVQGLVGLPLGKVLPGQGLGSLAAFRPPLADRHGNPQGLAVLDEELSFRIRVLVEVVDRNDNRQAKTLEAGQVPLQVRQPGPKGLGIFAVQLAQGFAPVVFQGANGGYQHYGFWRQPGSPTFDV